MGGQHARRRAAGRRIRVLAGILALAAGPASAVEYDASGYYMGIFGAAGFDVAGEDLEPSGGLDIKLGYRHGARFGSEIEGEWMQLYGAEEGGGGVETWFATANGKVHVLTGRVQPFVAAGFGLVYLNDTRDVGGEGKSLGVGGKVGAGLEVYLNPDLLVAPEVRFNWSAGTDIELRTVTVGLGLEFY